MPDNTPREPDYNYPSFVARFRSAPDVFMAALVKWVDTYSARLAGRSIVTERDFEYFGEDALRLMARSGSKPIEGIPRAETVCLHGVRTLAHDGKGGFVFERHGPLMEVRAMPLSGEVIEVECFLYDVQLADYFAALCDEITGIGRACGGLELVDIQEPSAHFKCFDTNPEDFAHWLASWLAVNAGKTLEFNITAPGNAISRATAAYGQPSITLFPEDGPVREARVSVAGHYTVEGEAFTANSDGEAFAARVVKAPGGCEVGMMLLPAPGRGKTIHAEASGHDAAAIDADYLRTEASRLVEAGFAAVEAINLQRFGPLYGYIGQVCRIEELPLEAAPAVIVPNVSLAAEAPAEPIPFDTPAAEAPAGAGGRANPLAQYSPDNPLPDDMPLPEVSAADLKANGIHRRTYGKWKTARDLYLKRDGELVSTQDIGDAVGRDSDTVQGYIRDMKNRGLIAG